MSFLKEVNPSTNCCRHHCFLPFMPSVCVSVCKRCSCVCFMSLCMHVHMCVNLCDYVLLCVTEHECFCVLCMHICVCACVHSHRVEAAQTHVSGKGRETWPAHLWFQYDPPRKGQEEGHTGFCPGAALPPRQPEPPGGAGRAG